MLGGCAMALSVVDFPKAGWSKIIPSYFTLNPVVLYMDLYNGSQFPEMSGRFSPEVFWRGVEQDVQVDLSVVI